MFQIKANAIFDNMKSTKPRPVKNVLSLFSYKFSNFYVESVGTNFNTKVIQSSDIG